MKPSIFFSSWNPFEGHELNFSKLVSISVDTLSVDDNADIKILHLAEPTEIYSYIYEDINQLSKFDKVYTYNQIILDQIPNSELIEFGSCWLDFSDLNLNKLNHISFVTSTKNFTSGHELRHNIFNFFESVNTINGLEIYQHKSPPFHTRRNDFFEASKFHVAVENAKEINFFTEKLIDCFASKTIPVYYGCPNIGDFFNLDGMIIFNDYDEFLEKIGSITPSMYDEMQSAIEDNHERCKKYYGDNCITNRIRNKIIEFVNGKN
jgi:hypothetical protein